MIEPGSLIGFALAFVVASGLASLGLGGVLLGARRWLRSAGPLAERRAAASALLLPPVLALALVGVLAGFSVVGPWIGIADHCAHHGDHLHLCLRHGRTWTSHTWAVVGLGALGLVFGLGLARRAWRLWSARVEVSRLARVSQRLEVPGGEVYLAPSTSPFCFVAGLVRPRIFVSTAAWALLDEDERTAMLAHELAHAEQRDLLRASLLDVATFFGTPWIAPRVARSWDAATERLCDHRAAVATGGPEPLARALVAMARGGGEQVSLGACFVRDGGDVVERVEAVLAGRDDGHRLATRLTTLAGGLIVSTAVLAIVLVRPLHHLLESLLGRL